MEVMMFKRTLTIIVLMLSSSAFANPEQPRVCISHGDCQDYYGTQKTQKCFIVKTGSSYNGEVTCNVRCYSVVAGSLCKRVEGSIYGLCKVESFPRPIFNPSDPNRCDIAIDPL